MVQAIAWFGNLRANLRNSLTAPNFLPFCFCLYMALRIAVLFVSPLEQFADFAWYYGRATELAAGGGYADGGVPTAFWPVGWPGFLGLLFRLTGPSALAGQIANLCFAALVFVLTAKLGSALFRDKRVGNLAVLILTLCPNQIAYVPLLSTEIFFQALLLGSILLLMRQSIRATLLAGLVLGIATLTKTQTLLIPAFVFGIMFLFQPSRAAFMRLLAHGCVLYIVMLLVVAPWTYRNYVVLHAFVPVSTNGGWTLLTGNNPETDGSVVTDSVLTRGISHDPVDQVAMDHLATARAVAWIAANPVRFVSILPSKFLHFWLPDGEGEWGYEAGFAGYAAHVVIFRTLRGINQVYYFAILALALPTLWQLIRRRRQLTAWSSVGLALCIYFTLISLVFSGQSRYHFCLIPCLAIYAAWTVVRWMDRATVPATRPA